MALFTRSDLVERARPATFAKAARAVLVESVQRFSATAGYDVFVSHSSLDAEVVLGLKLKLEDHGLRVYVDWIDDPALDRSRVTAKTAQTLRDRMGACHALFYAHSANSVSSKWMPWELGYFDGLGGRVAIVPFTETRQETFAGQEYLGLYPYVDEAPSSQTAKQHLWVNSPGVQARVVGTWLRPS